MKKPGENNNMYAEAKAHALEPYARAVEGSFDAAICVVFADRLADEARAALRAACEGIGFSEPSFLDAALLTEDNAEKDLFAAIEALDPLMLAVADAAAAARLAAAYREPVAADAYGFVFGRPYAAFSSFQRDLADPRMKQRDWALLKAMRKSADWLG
ncbi:MAG: hypothetical protein Q4B69_07045 [Slackia sp.]|nr:hypothetical protein [Slackia sp.]